MSSLLTREALVDSRTQAGALVGIGVAVWVLGTVVLRLVGHLLLPPAEPGRVTLVFAATVPVMAMLAFAVYSLLDVDPERRLTAATLLVLPGMVFDAAVVTAFTTVFPNMATGTGSTFGGLMLLAYASILVTGVVPLTYVGEESSPRSPRATEHAADQPQTAERTAGGDPVGEGSG
jgi:branched-subunit amino acid transport protein AzlD